MVYCSSCTCMRVASAEELYSCIKRVQNSLRTAWSWPFSLISDGFLRPVILHVILPCSLATGGRSQAVRLLCYVNKNGNMYMANNSSNFQYCRGMSIEEFSSLPHNRASLISVRKLMGGGGGLNCEAKAQVLVITLPPLF